jgi:Zn-dependent membrane protease YugP
MLEDPLFWVLVLPGLLLGTYAQWRIKANVATYSQVSTKDGITGAEVARRLLNSRGLQNDVKVEATPGMLIPPRLGTPSLASDICSKLFD